MAKSLGEFFVKIGGDISELDQSLSAAEKRFKSSTETMTKLGKGLTTFVTLPILALGAAAVKSAADMEMQQAAFETLLGSAADAEKMLKDLAKFAAETPFQLPDLAKASKTMLAFGIEADKVLPTLKQLGDIAQGDAAKLGSLTLAFSQIQSTGRLMGQDLLQLINAGFNPLQIISEKTGKTMAQLKKEMEAGAISAEQVAEAFEIATSEGGRFFGGMEKASQTFAGQLSTLKDNVGALGRSLVESLLPILKDIVKTVSSWVEGFSKLTEEQRKSILVFAGIAAAIGPLILGGLKLIQMLQQLKVAMLFLNAHPAILAFTAIAAAVAVVAIGFKRAKDEANNLNAALSGNADLEQTRLALANQIAKVEERRAGLARAQADKRISAETVAGLQKMLDQELATLKLVNDNYNGKLRNLQTEKDRQAAAEKAAAAERKAAEDAAKASAAALNNLSAEKESVKDKEIAYRDFGYQLDDELESYKDIEAAVARGHETWKNADDERKAREVDWQALQKDGLNAVLKSFSDIGAAFVDGEAGWKIFAKAGLNAIAAVLDALGGQLAAMAALNFFGIPPNIPGGIGAAVGSAAAFTAAGAVRATVPNLAEGGIVMPRAGGTLANVAEAGVPEIVGPIDKVTNMLRASGAGVDSTPVHLVVNMDSRPFLDKIFDATRNRTVLISAGAVV